MLLSMSCFIIMSASIISKAECPCRNWSEFVSFIFIFQEEMLMLIILGIL